MIDERVRASHDRTASSSSTTTTRRNSDTTTKTTTTVRVGAHAPMCARSSPSPAIGPKDIFQLFILCGIMREAIVRPRSRTFALYQHYIRIKLRDCGVVMILPRNETNTHTHETSALYHTSDTNTDTNRRTYANTKLCVCLGAIFAVPCTTIVKLSATAIVTGVRSQRHISMHLHTRVLLCV